MVQAQRDWLFVFGHVLLHDAIVDRDLGSFEMLQCVKDGVSRSVHQIPAIIQHGNFASYAKYFFPRDNT